MSPTNLGPRTIVYDNHFEGWQCIRCGHVSRNKFGKLWHTHAAWNWRKGHGSTCSKFLWWGKR